jgi:solute carrier family 25 protein 38
LTDLPFALDPARHLRNDLDLTCQLILQDRGMAGFFSGSTLRISRKAMSGAIGWTVYEGLLLFLRDRV